MSGMGRIMVDEKFYGILILALILADIGVLTTGIFIYTITHIHFVIIAILLLLPIIFTKDPYALIDSLAVVVSTFILLNILFPYTYLGSFYLGIVSISIAGLYTYTRFHYYCKNKFYGIKISLRVYKRFVDICSRCGVYFGVAFFFIAWGSFKAGEWAFLSFLFMPLIFTIISSISLLGLFYLGLVSKLETAQKQSIAIILVGTGILGASFLLAFQMFINPALFLGLYFPVFGLGIFCTMFGASLCLQSEREKYGVIQFVFAAIPYIPLASVIYFIVIKPNPFAFVACYIIAGIFSMGNGLFVYMKGRALVKTCLE